MQPVQGQAMIRMKDLEDLEQRVSQKFYILNQMMQKVEGIVSVDVKTEEEKRDSEIQEVRKGSWWFFAMSDCTEVKTFYD